MIVMGGNQLDAYDPDTGKQLWLLTGIPGTAPSPGPPWASDGLRHGRKRGPLLAVKPGGRGELPPEAIAWRHAEGTPDTPCPVVWGDLLFMVNDDGVARCLDGRTGKVDGRSGSRGLPGIPPRRRGAHLFLEHGGPHHRRLCVGALRKDLREPAR